MKPFCKNVVVIHPIKVDTFLSETFLFKKVGTHFSVSNFCVPFCLFFALTQNFLSFYLKCFYILLLCKLYLDYIINDKYFTWSSLCIQSIFISNHHRFVS